MKAKILNLKCVKFNNLIMELDIVHPHIYGNELYGALIIKISKVKFITNENLEGYSNIFNTFKVTGMQTLEKYLMALNGYVLCNRVKRKSQNAFLLSTWFVLQILLFKRKRNQLYAKWTTFGFWPLKMCTICLFTHGAALRSPYHWDWTI